MTSYSQTTHYLTNGPTNSHYFKPIGRDIESYQSFGSIGSRRQIKEVRYDETPGKFHSGAHFAEGISVNVNNHNNNYYDESKYSIGSAVTSRASYQVDSGLPNVRPQKPCKITFKMDSYGEKAKLNNDHIIDTQKEFETFSEKTLQDSYKESIVIHHNTGNRIYSGGLTNNNNYNIGETFTTTQTVYNAPVTRIPSQPANDFGSANYGGASAGYSQKSGIYGGGESATETLTEITKSPEWRIMRQSRTDDTGEKIYYELKQIKNDKGEWENVDVLPGDTTNLAASTSEWAKWSTKSVDPITGTTKTDSLPTISGEYWIQRKKDNTWKRVKYHWEHDPNGQWKKINSDTGKIISTQGNWKTGTAWELDKNAVPRKVPYEWVMENNGQWRMEKKGRRNRPVDTTWQEGSEWIKKDSDTSLVNYRWVPDKNGKWLKLNQDTGDILETVPKGKGLNITKSDVQYYYHTDKGKLIKNVTTKKFQDGKLRSKKVHQEDIPKEESDFMLQQAAMRRPRELLSGQVNKAKRQYRKYESGSLPDTTSNRVSQISTTTLQNTGERLIQ